MAGSGVSHILRALGANFIIAVTKGIGAFFTGSAAMLAETLHSLSDCVNQVLLLVGLRQAKRAPDARYPLGQGRSLYFWSFMVAMLLFLGGGTYSIYEGIHKLGLPPEEIHNPFLAIGILAFGFVVEFWAMLGVLKIAKQRRGEKPFLRYLRESKDSDVVVIFGEDFAAVLGLGLALIAVILTAITGDPTWDAIGTLGIGAVLLGIAIFLAVEVKSLLVGEGADPDLVRAIEAVVTDDPNVVKVMQTIAVQQGPGEILVAMKLQFREGMQTDELVDVINVIEEGIRAKVPDARWCFIEPDRPLGV